MRFGFPGYLRFVWGWYNITLRCMDVLGVLPLELPRWLLWVLGFGCGLGWFGG